MSIIEIHDKKFIPYLSHKEIVSDVEDLAKRIYEDYKDQIPVFIGVLNGVILFFSDLLKAYPGYCEIGFVQMSSYVGTQSTGIVYKKMELTKEIKGRHVVLLEDIVDTGNTVECLYQYFRENYTPKSIRIASLFLKPEVYKKNIKIDYVGREIPNKFIVGYGLDYNELGRNLSGIYRIEE